MVPTGVTPAAAAAPKSLLKAVLMAVPGMVPEVVPGMVPVLVPEVVPLVEVYVPPVVLVLPPQPEMETAAESKIIDNIINLPFFMITPFPHLVIKLPI
jgi:hypothetical protein